MGDKYKILQELEVASNASFIGNISGNNIYSNGVLVATQPQVNNFIGGQITIPVDVTSLNIADVRITSGSNPVCTIQSPSPNDVISIPMITNLQNGSFDVELSMAVPISGYYMNWMSFAINS